MSDDGVRERHGVASFGGGFVDVRETENKVKAALYDGTNTARSTTISAADAVYLAEQLYRLANRINARHRPLMPAQTPGSAGGNARAANLSAERRSEIARKAANARWGKA